MILESLIVLKFEFKISYFLFAKKKKQLFEIQKEKLIDLKTITVWNLNSKVYFLKLILQSLSFFFALKIRLS